MRLCCGGSIIAGAPPLRVDGAASLCAEGGPPPSRGSPIGRARGRGAERGTGRGRKLGREKVMAQEEVGEGREERDMKMRAAAVMRMERGSCMLG